MRSRTCLRSASVKRVKPACFFACPSKSFMNFNCFAVAGATGRIGLSSGAGGSRPGVSCMGTSPRSGETPGRNGASGGGGSSSVLTVGVGVVSSSSVTSVSVGSAGAASASAGLP